MKKILLVAALLSYAACMFCGRSYGRTVVCETPARLSGDTVRSVAQSSKASKLQSSVFVMRSLRIYLCDSSGVCSVVPADILDRVRKSYKKSQRDEDKR